MTSDDGTGHRLQHTTRMAHPQLTVLDENSQPRMDVAVEILDLRLYPIRGWEYTIFFYIVLAPLTVVNL